MLNQSKKLLYPVLWVLWAFLSSEYLLWFLRHLPQHFDLLNGSLFIAIGYLWFQRTKPKLAGFFLLQPNLSAVSLAFVSIVLLIVLKIYSPIRLFGFVASMLLAFSLAGMAMTPQRWVQNLIPFALIVMTLPFGRHLDVFIGYPLRMLSVDLAHQALWPIMPELNSTQSLLILENRASQVDMDCSGLKGIWVATLVYFVITWIEQSRIGVKWFTGLCLLLLYLVFGNLLRIVLLSLVHIYWQQDFIDPWIHHSTSVFFLLTGVALCYGYLHFLVAKKKPLANKPIKYSFNLISPQLAIATLLVTGLLVPTFQSNQSLIQNTDLHAEITHLGWSPLNLSPAEAKVYSREGVVGQKFKKGQNQIILVYDGDWRSQHKPELCYELSGLPISNIQTLLLKEKFPVRQLEFENREERAYFWFQCGEEVTEDFATKVWRQIGGVNKQWTLVSLLSITGQIPHEDILAIHQLLTQKEH